VVSVDRTALNRQSDGGKAVLQRLSTLLNVPYHRLNHETQQCGLASNGKTIGKPCWAGSPYEPIPVSELKPDIHSTKQALEIEEMQENYPGVSAQLAAVRHYPQPQKAQASAILGYLTPISPDQLKKLSQNQQAIQRGTEVGANGLEAQYQKYLRGTPGLKQVTVDHLGGVTGTIKNTAPIGGDDLVTNLDAKAQATLESQLQKALDAAHHDGYTGDYDAGVVLNARTGGIVAMASNPSYAPNRAPSTLTAKQYKALLHQPGSPLFDKAFQGVNPPGSTFKMISSSGLLNDGQISPGGLYDCPTDYLGRHSFEGTPGLGSISLQEAIEVSCDTFFFELGAKDWYRDDGLIKAHKKPREGVQHMARDLGLGESPDVDLPNAATGHIPDRQNTRLEWQQNKANYCEGAKRRQKGTELQRLDAEYCATGYLFEPGDQENVDVGQGTVTASPLQMAVAYAALANGGTVFEPRVAKAIFSPQGKLIKRIKAPVRDHIPLPQSTLSYLRNAFYLVTSGSKGTAKAAFAGFPMSQVQVGGKTGTAELPNTQQNDSWFVSFGGPAGQKPQYVTVIEVDKSREGAISAAPFVRNMWDALYGFGSFKGKSAIFPNGVPPKKLPKVGPVEAKAQAAKALARSKAHKHHPGTQTPGTTSTSSPPPTSSTSSTSTTGAGLPPGLPVVYRRWAAQ
jgi:penicillin-binding protein 2